MQQASCQQRSLGCMCAVPRKAAKAEDMPVAPRETFFKYTCTACGWSTVIKQHSDVLVPGPLKCANCGSSSLKLETSRFPVSGFVFRNLKTAFEKFFQLNESATA